MDTSSKSMYIVIAVVLMAIIAGEIYVNLDSDRYNVSVSFYDGTVVYDVSASGSKTFDILVIDGADDTRKALIYLDSDYTPAYDPVDVAIGSKDLDESYYVDQLTKQLSIRRMTDVMVADAESLPGLLESEEFSGCDLIMVSGAIPGTVYDGTKGCILSEWIDGGGRLYWVGNIIGKYVSDHGKLTGVDPSEVFPESGYQKITADKGYSVMNDDLTSGLCISDNGLKNAVDISRIPSGTKHLELGFTDSACASICMMSHGEGMVCIIGGDYSGRQIQDLAQIVAAGLSPESELVAQEHGSVTNSTIHGEMAATGDHRSAYVFLGGYYAVFGYRASEES